MYAVIASGGKQYRVEEGQVLHLEKLPHEEGETITFDQVLLVADGENVTVGTPMVEKANVSAEILAQERGDKIHIIKFRRRKHHMKRAGHRQYLTKVKITGISASGAAKAEAKPKAAAKPKATEAKPKKEAEPKASAAKKPAAKKSEE